MLKNYIGKDIYLAWRLHFCNFVRLYKKVQDNISKQALVEKKNHRL